MGANEEQSDKFEQAYAQGERAAYSRLLSECLRNLGPEERDAHSWVKERADAIQALRNLCSALGCNDWPDDLYLADIITEYVEPSIDFDA